MSNSWIKAVSSTIGSVDRIACRCRRLVALLMLVVFSNFQQTVVYAAVETIAAGAYIVDMGQLPQSEENAVKPYGLVYDLVMNNNIPVTWAFDQSANHAIDGVTEVTPINADFTADGKNYYGSGFIIPADYAAVAAPIIATWQAKGVVVDGPTLASFSADVYATITYIPSALVTGDQIVDGFYDQAEISAYAEAEVPSEIPFCSDIWAMPHADPHDWGDTELEYFDCFIRNDISVHTSCASHPLWAGSQRSIPGNFWAACHSVSSMEAVGFGGLHFLSTGPEQGDPIDVNLGAAGDGLIDWGSHNNTNTPPFTYNPAAASDPIMQIIGILDDALSGGSEEINVPNTNLWRSSTTIGVYDPAHPDAPGGGVQGEAALVAYGKAYGNSSYGNVIYETSHSFQSGSDAENASASRIYGNFLLNNGVTIGASLSMTASIPSAIAGGNSEPVSASMSGGDPAYTAEWTTTCAGATFDDATALATNFNAPVVTVVTNCIITVKVADMCGRSQFISQPVTISASVTLGLTKTATASACPIGTGGTPSNTSIDYVLTPIYIGTTLLDNVCVSDSIPTGTTFSSATPAQTMGPNPLEWCLGSNTAAVDGDDIGVVVTTLNATKDNWIDQDNSGDNHGADGTLIVDPSVAVENKNEAARILTQFDLSSIPAGATITAGSLTMTQTAVGVDASTRTFDVHALEPDGAAPFQPWAELNSNWDEFNDTLGKNGGWDTKGGDFNATVAASQTVTTALTSFSWDILSLVQSWNTIPADNFGIIIKDSTEDEPGDNDDGMNAVDFDNTHSFSSPPTLDVTYQSVVSTNSIAATPLLIVDGGTITVTQTLGSTNGDAGPINPGVLDVAITGSAAVVCGSASPASHPSITAGGSVEFVYSCTVSGGALGDTVVFDNGTTLPSGATTSWVNATSNSVIISETLNFTVDVDAGPTAAFSVSNTASVADDTTFTTPIVSGAVVTDIPDTCFFSPPVADDDSSYGNTAGTAVTIDPLANDTDNSGTGLDATSVVLLPGATGGTLSPDGKTLSVPGEGTWTVDVVTGAITFSPTPGFVDDPTSIEYTVADNNGDVSNIATVTIGYSVPPVANDDISTGNTPGVAVAINPLVNDSDPNGSVDPTSVSLDPASIAANGGPAGATCDLVDASGDCLQVTVPGEGVWTVDPSTGLITFTPDPSFSGDPTPIGYDVRDNDGLPSNVATVTIDYLDPPIAGDDAGSGATGSPVVVSLLANDSDPDGTVDATTVNLDAASVGGTCTTGGSPPADCKTVEVAGVGIWTEDGSGNLTFTPCSAVGVPLASCTGVLSGDPAPINYTVMDNDGLTSDPATVTVSYLTKRAITNDDVSTGNTVGDPVVIDPLANDIPSSFPIDPTSVSLDPTAVGVGACDVGQTDAQGDCLQVTVPGEGVWTVNPVTGAVTFTPEASFSGDPTPIEYDIRDTDGNDGTNESQISIFYLDPPIAGNDAAGGFIPGANAVINPLANDSDPDGTIDATTVSLDPASIPGSSCTNVEGGSGDCLEVTVPGEGVWTVDPVTGVVTFDPDPAFSGDPTPIEYTVRDNDGQTSNAATISLDYAADEPPVANDDSSSGNTLGAAVTIDPLANDTDPNDMVEPDTVSLDPASVTGGSCTNVEAGSGDCLEVTIPGEGVWTVNPTTGAITFTPEGGFTGQPQPIDYTVRDTVGNTSNAATVTVLYQGAPVANDVQSLGNTQGATVELDPVAGAVTTAPGASIDASTVVLQIPPGAPSGTTLTPDGKTLVVPGEGTWQVCSAAGAPVASCTGEGKVVFTPEVGFTGNPIPINFTIDDSLGNTSNVASLTVTYLQPPVPNDDTSIGNTVGDSVSMNLLANDSDPDGTIDPTSVDFDPTGIVNGGGTPAVGTDTDGDGDIDLVNLADVGQWSVDNAGNMVFTPCLGPFPATPAPTCAAAFTTNPPVLPYNVTDNDGQTSLSPANIIIGYSGTPILTDDADLNNIIGNAVTLDILANDDDGAGGSGTGAFDASTIRLYDGGTPLAAGASLVVPGEGTWSVNTTTGEVTFTPLGSFTGDPTPIDYDVETTGGTLATPASITVTYDQNTPITLGYFKTTAGPNEGDVLFEWRTATELGNVGFELYAYRGGLHQWSRVNPELIPGIGDSQETTVYQYQAYGVKGNMYAIIDIDLTGKETVHGPYELGQEYGSIAVARQTDWNRIRSEQGLAPVGEDQSSNTPARRSWLTKTLGSVFVALLNLTSTAAEAALPTKTDLVNIAITETGVYRISYDDIVANSGVDLAAVKLKDLALLNNGQPVAIRIVVSDQTGGSKGSKGSKGGKGSKGKTFGPGATLEFVADGFNDLYTDQNIYTLRIDRKQALSIKNDKRKVPGGSSVSYYRHTTQVEPQNKYIVTSPDDEPWYYDRLVAISGAATKDVTIDLDHYVDGAAIVEVEAGVWGGTALTVNPDHHVMVDINGVPVIDETFDGLSNQQLNGTVASSGIVSNGTNTISFTSPHDTGAAFDIVSIDYWSVSYAHDFVSASGTGFDFSDNGHRYTVTGLSDKKSIKVYTRDSASGRVAQLKKLKRKGDCNKTGLPSCSVTFAGTQQATDYFVVTDSGYRAPDAITAPPVFDDISTGNAQFLIIAHPSFMGPDLNTYIATRQARYSVKLVDVDQIYAQFGGYRFGAQPIQDYLVYAAANLGTTHVLLVGGDSRDYHDYQGQGSLSFIPSLYSQTSYLVRFAPTDARYVDLNDDDVPDLAIGRWPVRTLTELQAVINKTLAYDQKGYGNSAVFAADQTDVGAAYSFKDDAEQMIAKLPASWQNRIERAFLDDNPLVTTKAKLIDAINLGAPINGDPNDRTGGVALTAFVGHSSTDTWTFSGLFNNADAINLANQGSPTVVTQWGCWNTYYVFPDVEPMANAFLLNGEQGAAAVAGASTLTQAGSERMLALELYDVLFDTNATLGEALTTAKQNLALNNPSTAHLMLDVLLGWTLLGDPTLQVQ